MQLTIGAWFMRCYPQLGWKIPLLSALFLTGLVYFGLDFTRTHYDGFFASALYYFAYTWFGLVFLSFCVCAAFAVVCKILLWCHVPTAWMGTASLVTLIVVWAMAFWGGFSAPKVKRIAVNIPGAPRLKLALLSDTHLGMGVSLARFDKALQKIEAENPDALLVLGDIFEYGPHREAYAKRLSQVKTPLGSYGVLGNHEYYVGYGDSKEFFKEANVTLLENTGVALPNGVQIAGLKDIHTAGVTAVDVARLLDSLQADKPTVLLSHTPALAETAAAHGANLMLSGHTHNGQLWPFTYLVKLQFPRVYGLYSVEQMSFYITSGVFYWGIPLRFLAPAEIAVIEVNA
ncbi:MAG: metallophosphoesterase [Elusimicrobiaceae bacterium]|nr:metallophosphoesterase [Elusimicrobiaceae bacterium]